MRLKPARPGSAIPDPAKGDMLPETGRDVAMTRYWRRRLRAGDVTPVERTPRGPEASVAPDIEPGDVEIPDSWRDLPWTQPKGETGMTLRGLAAAVSPDPIITMDDAIKAVEAELARRAAQEED